MKGRLITGLDLGSSAIRIAVGQVSMGQDHQAQLTLIGAAETKSEGIAKASITSLEDAVSSISACLDQAERMVGLPLQDVYVAVGGSQITVQEAKGIIGVSRGDQDVKREDVARVLEAARTFAQTPNYEILHVLPVSFTVDSQKDIKDPIGMQGIRLEVTAKVIQGLSNHLKNVTKTVFRTNVDIAELVYAPLAAAEAVSNKRQKELGVCIVNMGAATTGMAVYENGELVHAATFLIGADHITSDIAITLRTSIEVAEKIKRTKGHALPSFFGKQDMVDLKEYGSDIQEAVQLSFISEVIEARLEEIFEKVEDELKKIDRSGLLPAGVVLTGGGSKLPGVVEVAKQVLHLPASIGVTSLESSMPELIKDPAFSTAVGLVEWGFEAERQGDQTGGLYNRSLKQASGVFTRLSDPIKKIFKSFMP
ncbi:MAG: cell division protein FtsA [Patescibacteria group bacterium]|nr:cell division protein FtsA [Patescibacteria group bacterium]